MDIKTAIEIALKNGKHITNSYYAKIGIKFLPTNTDDCIVCKRKGSSFVRWNPTADDLIDVTWEVTQ